MNISTKHLETRLIGWALDTDKDYGLSPEDFNDEAYQLVWFALLEARKHYNAVDYVILGDYVRQKTGEDWRDDLQAIWENRLEREDLAETYAERLRDLNATSEIKTRLSQIASEWDNPEQLRDQVMTAMQRVARKGTSTTTTVSETLPKVVDDIERRYNSDSITGVSTGLPRLDEKTGGFQKSDLTVIAARPAVGKTAFMLNLALAAKGRRVAIVSAEQPAIQLTQRLIAIVGRLSAWKLRNPRALADEEWKRVTSACAQLKALDIHIFDASAPTMSRIETKVADLEPEIVFLDYIQRIKAPGQIYERTSAVALGCKELAREHDIPVVALAQINRSGAQNAAMHHLKGSGDIEQEADQVILLERTKETPHSASLVLEKNRHGPTGAIELYYDAETMRFEEMTNG